jgi:hypothetical protein
MTYSLLKNRSFVFNYNSLKNQNTLFRYQSYKIITLVLFTNIDIVITNISNTQNTKIN